MSDDLPEWLGTLSKASETVEPEQLSRFVPPQEPSVRDSAVLILMADDGDHPDVLLTERAWTLRSHAGQMSFPGGRVDSADGEGDQAIVNAALREAQEETGLDPSGVQVFAVWPALWVPVSNFAVSPVLAWWREPSPVAVVDPAEVASVHRVELAALADPRNRVMCAYPSGFSGPAFVPDGLFIWGFTALLLERLLQLGGWAREWDTSRIVPLPDKMAQAAWRDRSRLDQAEQRLLKTIEHDLARPDDEA